MFIIIIISGSSSILTTTNKYLKALVRQQSIHHFYTLKTYLIFLWVADFYPKNVIHKPVNRLVFVEQENEFYHQTKVTWAEKLSYWIEIQ